MAKKRKPICQKCGEPALHVYEGAGRVKDGMRYPYLTVIHEEDGPIVTRHCMVILDPVPVESPHAS